MSERRNQTTELRKIKNGYEVQHSYRVKLEKENRYGENSEHRIDTYAYSTLEEAVGQVKELATTFK